MMLKIYDNFFNDEFLFALNTKCRELSWQYTNVANRGQYPKDSLYTEGTHRFFGAPLYYKISHNRNYDVAPPIIHEVYDFFFNEILEEKTSLVRIDGNLQVYGQDGSTHTDFYVRGGKDRTLLLFPHYKWDESWGGCLEILDDDDNVTEQIMPSPGRVVYFDSSVRHRGLAPTVKNIARMSVAYRLSI